MVSGQRRRRNQDLTIQEIISRSIEFSNEFADDFHERGEAQTFWNEFFDIFGIVRRRVANFEVCRNRLGGARGFVDLFWPGMLLVEHKSRGESLDTAFGQASDYFTELSDREIPRYIMVSDFQRFRLYDYEGEPEEYHEFALAELSQNIHLFGFISGFYQREVAPENPVNVRAAEVMGRLYVSMRDLGYEEEEIQILQVRILFCLFAEDTGIIPRQGFSQYIEMNTPEDGSTLGPVLAHIFQILSTPEELRSAGIPEELDEFPFIDGELFEQSLSIVNLNSEMRRWIIECGALDWGEVSPAIFGSMFQSVMDDARRRDIGAHYTSEANILKLINSLFMDGLREEFERIRNRISRLKSFHDRLSEIRILDPACGCGNFLVIAYRELRLLELEVIRAMHGSQQVLDIRGLLRVTLDQMFGIEIEHFPARIARISLWLVDHQMNMLVSQEFGIYYVRFSFTDAGNISVGNSLEIEWDEVIPREELSYIIGNPPFIGAHRKSEVQKDDMVRVFEPNRLDPGLGRRRRQSSLSTRQLRRLYGRSSLISIRNHGKLDYVCAWYKKAAEYTQETSISFAFVSTNSIVQGEQVPIIWPILLNDFELLIQFAHRTFNWRNEARGEAHVHCVIIGLSRENDVRRSIFDYEDPNSEPLEISANQINPYLFDSPPVFVTPVRSGPISDVPSLARGSIPYDGGNLILSEAERDSAIQNEPDLEPLIRRYGGARESLRSEWRYCLWLEDIHPNTIRDSPFLSERIEECRRFRQNSETVSVNRGVDTPFLFGDRRQPNSDYLLIPRVSSSRRNYIPMSMIGQETILADGSYGVPEATLYHFGVLSSSMHNAWVRLLAGRLKNDLRYSAVLLYNTFIWPDAVSRNNRRRVEACAQEVLDARTNLIDDDTTLGDIYRLGLMPAPLVQAHRNLDSAVDRCYTRRRLRNDQQRTEFLFELYLNAQEEE